MITFQEINRQTSEDFSSIANERIDSFDSLVKKIQNIVTINDIRKPTNLLVG
jgi:hypothetical protein